MDNEPDWTVDAKEDSSIFEALSRVRPCIFDAYLCAIGLFAFDRS